MQDTDDFIDELPQAPGEHRPHGGVVRSDTLDVLVGGPVTSDSMPGDGVPPAGPLRDMVRVLRGPVTGKNTEYNHGTWLRVYHLYGDERRAIRLAIEENAEYIATAFDGGGNVFKQEWDPGMYRLLCEEWEYYRLNGGFDERER